MFQRSGASANSGEGGTIPLCLVPGRGGIEDGLRVWVQWKALLAAFREEYNQVRPHEALATAVPATRYQPSRKAYTARPREWEYPLAAWSRD